MAHEVDFDALARKANESGGAMEDLNRLFGAAFALPVWSFVARGELPDIHPYVASKADVEGGRNRVRAFTDTNRLQRFAKENNLTAPNGSAKMLNVPTDKVIDYLEGFIQNDVHGVWFNSDRASDGFFLPLKQLRPTKEYLEKLNQQSSGESRADGDVTIKPVFIPPVSAQTPQSSNLENWGVSDSPGGGVDININIARPGTVKPDTTLAPFLGAIVPLLADYQGTGEYAHIFNFVPGAVENLLEDITTNSHGAYLRVRMFQYNPPNGSRSFGATTIDSRHLRHVQTGAPLLVSLVLLTFPGDPTAVLEFRNSGKRGRSQKVVKSYRATARSSRICSRRAESITHARS